jgi:hypothetical protein
MMVEKPVVREANTGQAYSHIALDASETMLHIHHVHPPSPMGSKLNEWSLAQGSMAWMCKIRCYCGGCVSFSQFLRHFRVSPCVYWCMISKVSNSMASPGRPFLTNSTDLSRLFWL